MANQEKTNTSYTNLTWDMIGVDKPLKNVSPKDFAIWIRALLQNWRQGTLGVKDRSEVNRTGKKPWKQKGTGRARAGTARSPLWRGGGVSFGPQERVKTLKVTGEKKKQILLILLTQFLENNKVKVVNWELSSDNPRTKEAARVLNDLQLKNCKTLVLLPIDDAKTYASFSNILSVQPCYFDQINAYDLAGNDMVIVFKKDLEQFNNMVKRWS